MTLAQFAKMMGFNAQFWWKVVHGKKNLSVINAEKVAAEMNTEEKLWMDPRNTALRRQEAWRKYKEITK